MDVVNLSLSLTGNIETEHRTMISRSILESDWIPVLHAEFAFSGVQVRSSLLEDRCVKMKSSFSCGSCSDH